MVREVEFSAKTVHLYVENYPDRTIKGRDTLFVNPGPVSQNGKLDLAKSIP